MIAHGIIQKWCNSSATLLQSKVLSTAGINNNGKVDIQADNSHMVIQLYMHTLEMTPVIEGLAKAISLVDEMNDR